MNETIVNDGFGRLFEQGLLGTLLGLSLIAIVFLYRENLKLNKFNRDLSKDTLTTLAKVSILTESMMQAFRDSSGQITKEISDRAADVKTHITSEVNRINTDGK